MIITLKGATFTHKLNLNVWLVNSSLVGVDSSNTASSVTKGGSYTTTFTIKSGFKIDDNSTVSVVCNGQTYPLSWSSNEAGGTATLTIDEVTAPITITVKASTVSGTVVDPDTGDDNEIIVVAYASRQSSSGISKSTGEYLSSTTGYVNIYESIDPTQTYAVTSYAPSSTSDNACVCYYTSDGTFVSAESGSDWGISSVEYTMQELTVPSVASIIKLFGRTNNQEAVLYLTSTISMTEISYSSQSTSSNMNETTGELGSSSSGYVNVYDNIDASKTYYASGFCPNASGTAAFVCYYTSDGTFISAQDGNDFGASSENVVKQKLTVPSTTSTIKVFAQSGQTAAALYVEA